MKIKPIVQTPTCNVILIGLSEQILHKKKWPSGSKNLNTYDFFLWDHLNDKNLLSITEEHYRTSTLNLPLTNRRDKLWRAVTFYLLICFIS